MLSFFSCVQPHETAARQAPLSMGFSRQEYWSGLPCPPPGDLPDSGIEPTSLKSPALAGRFFTTSATREAQTFKMVHVKKKNLKKKSANHYCSVSCDLFATVTLKTTDDRSS